MNKPESRGRREGRLFIIAAPSGGGKTSLVNALLEADSRLKLSVSHTTRAPRPGEVSGREYHFIDEREFFQRVENGEFLEHALVFGHHYGTHAGALSDQLKNGFDVILEIDWQGASQVRDQVGECDSIFILPPSLAALRQRLSKRGQDSEAVIDGRMLEAQSEISHWDEFDHLVVNEDFDTALGEIRSIIEQARSGRPAPRREYPSLLAELLGKR